MSEDALKAQGKLKIPTAWMVAVIGALATGFGNAAVAHVRLQVVEKDVAVLQARHEEDVRHGHEQDLALQHIADTLEAVQKSLNKIEGKLDASQGARSPTSSPR